MILSFFAASDTIVNMNLGERFSHDVQITEAKIAYDFQKSMEWIHGEVYSLQIDNIIRDKEEKDKALNALTNYPCIQKKAQWAYKWIENNRERFREIDNKQKKRAYAWKKIKMEFLLILI